MTFGAYFEHKTVLIPHDEKRHRGGEDAAHASASLLVVADGVGGWADHGVDPGIYSRHLVSGIFDQHDLDPTTTPKDLIKKQNPVTASLHQGSCTVTVLKIEGPNQIRTANIGDSGYALYHVTDDGSLELYFRSKEQQREFNFPYQVGSEGDDPSVAEEQVHSDVRENDVVMVYSDGYGDNIFTKDFLKCFEATFDKKTKRFSNMSKAANCQARRAYRFGKKEKYASPFQVGALKVGMRFMGGKHDDIAVIVAQFHGDSVPKAEQNKKEFFLEDKYTYVDADGPVEEVAWAKRVQERNEDF